MNFLNRIWPWKTINRLGTELAERDRQLALLKGCYEASQHQLESAKEKIMENEGHFRKLTRIIAVSAGFGLFALTCLSQPVQRQILSTNLSAMTQQFAAPGSVVQVTNTAGAVISVPHFGTTGPRSPQTNATIWNDHEVSANVPGIGSFLTYDFLYFNAATNDITAAEQDNFFIGYNPFSTDGSLVIIGEHETGNQQSGGPFIITPAVFWTNGVILDSMVIGHPPGYWLMGTNATHAAIGWAIQDSTVINLGSLGRCKIIQFSTIQSADGTLGVITNILGSALIGPVMNLMPSSTNDIMISSIGNIWTGPSTDNTFLSPGGLANSTSGLTNTIVGPELDLPVDNQNGQLNLNNNIWADGATTGRTPSTGTVKINSFLTARQRIVATNGFASFATNIQASISNLGFTNDVAHGWGTNNMIVDIIAVGETVAFYNRSGAQGQTSCGTLLFTDTGIANKEYIVGVNCGVTFSVGTFTSGTARAF